SDSVLERAAQQSGLVYEVLLDAHGQVIAASRGFAGTARAALLSRAAALEQALGRQRFSLSDIVAGGPAGDGLIELAVPVNAADGRRVLVSGVSPRLISAFVGNYLARIGSQAGTAYVIDGR